MNNSTTPDTRPRCGGTPGKPGLQCSRHGNYTQPDHTKDCYCPGCADCAQPATPSGEADARTNLLRRINDNARQYLPAFEAAIRAESSDALEEARAEIERLGILLETEVGARECADHDAEAAERLLQEVTEEITRRDQIIANLVYARAEQDDPACLSTFDHECGDACEHMSDCGLHGSPAMEHRLACTCWYRRLPPIVPYQPTGFDLNQRLLNRWLK